MTDLESRVRTLEREIAELRKIILTGNGHPPLTERTANLERASATQTWLLRTILGAVVGNFGALLTLAALLLRKLSEVIP